MCGVAIPLANWAQVRLGELLLRDAISAQEVMTARALVRDFAVPGPVSAGGGCRFHRAADGAVAINLARAEDRDLLPALFQAEGDYRHSGTLLAAFAQIGEAEALARGRQLGLAIAGLGEVCTAAPVQAVISSPHTPPDYACPLILDMTALWAGPLAARLLRMAGGRVMRLENPRRPDPLRFTDPVHFAALNAGKAVVTLDPATADGRDALLALIAQADIVLEAARPRALLQLGVDAEALVCARPGQVWITITGHGAKGEAANWVAFGDDAGVAGGLTRRLLEATGRLGFVGDAIADPLTGIVAAETALAAWREGKGGRYVLAMSGIVAEAIRETPANVLADQLRVWAGQIGERFAAETVPC